MSVKTLQILVGIFFLVLGLAGILPNVNEGVFALSYRYTNMELLFGVVELCCGIIMILSLFTFMTRKTIGRAVLVVFIFWIARIILSKIVWALPHPSIESFLPWLLMVSAECIIAASIWLLAQSYRK